MPSKTARSDPLSSSRPSTSPGNREVNGSRIGGCGIRTATLNFRSLRGCNSAHRTTRLIPKLITSRNRSGGQPPGGLFFGQGRPTVGAMPRPQALRARVAGGSASSEESVGSGDTAATVWTGARNEVPMRCYSPGQILSIAPQQVFRGALGLVSLAFVGPVGHRINSGELSFVVAVELGRESSNVVNSLCGG